MASTGLASSMEQHPCRGVALFMSPWSEILRVIVVGVIAYVLLVFMLRITGNRTLSKMNSFDFVITVAFGSTLAAILVDSTTLAVGMTALALLIGLQFTVTWLSVRSARISRIVKTQPTVLLKDGRFLSDAMQDARVGRAEITAAIRQHGYGGVELIHAVLLETDGSLSVIAQVDMGSASALEGML
jgi:uncharacterized membrane protein YcaP (DUF421 family)